ncbi:alpha-1A adrenergic receptor-like [Scleropages formosus]|uniref:Alpha-1A adrenergic receptor n=1 Tax=Scleropages formosus TaxID=113540 RepID=A0A0P7Y2M9_SCLFO|nr:alpha-1A adrenergic receptor-like [Scleropages formosus]
MVPQSEGVTSDFLTWNCSNCSQASVPDLNVPKVVVLGLVLGVFLVFGVLGNVLVILSVMCHRHLRTATHYFIANLAVADLLLSSAVLPFSAIFEMRGHWLFGRALCNAWTVLDVLCCTASILSLCAISVDRCLGVSYPLRYPAIVTERRGLLALAAVWALSTAISAGPLLGWREPAPEDESICAVNQEPGYAIFSAVGSFYLPLVIILVMYCRVYVVARRETLGLREGHKAAGSDLEGVTLRMHRGAVAIPDDEALRSRTHFTLRLLKFSHEKKAAKTLGIVVGCFVLCWLPFFLVLPIGSMCPSYRPSDTVFKVTFWLGYFNSCINPIIYPCSSKEFKRAFQNVLHGRCLGRMPRPAKPHCPFTGNTGPADPLSVRAQAVHACASCRQWKTTPMSSPPESARFHGKSLLKTCCCVSGAMPVTVPISKTHHITPRKTGEAV